MIRSELVSRLQLLIQTLAPPRIDAAQTPQKESQWVPGQALTATVLASLPNGRFRVQVGDIELDMNLPHNTQLGAQLELTFVSNEPRLTFALTRALSAAANSKFPVEAKPQVILSDSVRYLGALLQKISDQANAQVVPPSSAAPLLLAGPSDIKEFAASLRSAWSQSGLFYESHQAQWVAGERQLADLLLEPQGKLSALTPGARAEIAQKGVPASMRSDALPAPGAASVPAHAEAVSFYASHQTQWSAAERGPGELLHEPQGKLAPPKAGAGVEIAQENASVTMPVDALPKPGASELAVHPETVALVQQQLQTLDSRQVEWQGQVWQGQTMEWRVEERSAREGAAGTVEMPDWQTSLRLQLPRLGDVLATLAFTPHGLRLELKAKDAGTAQAMADAQGKLRSAMAASGLNVLAMSVERHEKI